MSMGLTEALLRGEYGYPRVCICFGECMKNL